MLVILDHTVLARQRDGDVGQVVALVQAIKSLQTAGRRSIKFVAPAPTL